MGAKLRSGWKKIRLRIRWLWRKMQDSLTATVIIVVLIALAAFALAVLNFGWDWTGFNGGISKITITSTVHGTTVATEHPQARTLWDFLQLANVIIATLAIITAGWWFYKSRSLAGTIQIILTLTGMTMVNDNTRIAIVRVQIKNVGRTRVKKYYCIFVAEEVKARSYLEFINIISAGSLIDFQYSRKQEIFSHQTEIEPNEEMYEDVALVLNETTFFAVGVQLKGKGTREAWSAFAIFNADDKAKVPTPTDLSTRQMRSSK